MKWMVMGSAVLALAACSGGGSGASASASAVSEAATAPTANASGDKPPQEQAPAGPTQSAPGGGVMPMQPAPASGGVPAIPGSLADARLRGDVMRTVLGGAAQIVPGCDPQQATQTLQVAGARVTRPPRNGGPWQEVWPLMLCGQVRMLQLDFTPTPRDGGTDFNIQVLQGQAPD